MIKHYFWNRLLFEGKMHKSNRIFVFCRKPIEKRYHKSQDPDGILTASLTKSSGFVIRGRLFCAWNLAHANKMLCVLHNFLIFSRKEWSIRYFCHAETPNSAWFKINDIANENGQEKHIFLFFSIILLFFLPGHKCNFNLN